MAFGFPISAPFLVSAVACIHVTKSCSFPARSTQLFPLHLHYVLATFWGFSQFGFVCLCSQHVAMRLSRPGKLCQHFHGASLTPKATPEKWPPRAFYSPPPSPWSCTVWLSLFTPTVSLFICPDIYDQWLCCPQSSGTNQHCERNH